MFSLKTDSKIDREYSFNEVANSDGVFEAVQNKRFVFVSCGNKYVLQLDKNEGEFHIRKIGFSWSENGGWESGTFVRIGNSIEYEIKQ